MESFLNFSFELNQCFMEVGSHLFTFYTLTLCSSTFESFFNLKADSRKASPIPESLELYVDQLSRNVNENHLKEIFGMFLISDSAIYILYIALNLCLLFCYMCFKC